MEQDQETFRHQNGHRRDPMPPSPRALRQAHLVDATTWSTPSPMRSTTVQTSTRSHISPRTIGSNGEMHTIKVEVDRQEVHLAYRRSYYADRPARSSPTAHAPVQDVANADPTGSSSPELMHLAMARGAPIPTNLLIPGRRRPHDPRGQARRPARTRQSTWAEDPWPLPPL